MAQQPSPGVAEQGCVVDMNDRILSRLISRLLSSDWLVTPGAFKGSNDRLSREDACKDEGHSDASSIKTVTSSSEDDCSVFSMKKGSLSAAAKSRI